jgi:hypothetical protein
MEIHDAFDEMVASSGDRSIVMPAGKWSQERCCRSLCDRLGALPRLKTQTLNADLRLERDALLSSVAAKEHVVAISNFNGGIAMGNRQCVPTGPGGAGVVGNRQCVPSGPGGSGEHANHDLLSIIRQTRKLPDLNLGGPQRARELGRGWEACRHEIAWAIRLAVDPACPPPPRLAPYQARPKFGPFRKKMRRLARERLLSDAPGIVGPPFDREKVLKFADEVEAMGEGAEDNLGFIALIQTYPQAADALTELGAGIQSALGVLRRSTAAERRTASAVAADDAEDTGDRPSLDARAVALLTDHPEWTDRRIAKTLKCHRTSLYRLRKYTAARKLLKQQGKAAMPKGVKPQGGALEAWDNDADSDDDECE